MGPMSERFEMRMDEDLLAKVDTWRGKQNDPPSRAEAIRRLIEIGLERDGGEVVHFTDGEKLLLVMMGDLYKRLKIDGEIDPDLVCNVIWGGHSWALKDELTGIFHGDEDDPQEVKLVKDVLDMWRFIEAAYGKLSKKDKERIAKEAEPLGSNVKFRGFDGNNESKHLGIANFLTRKLGLWEEFAGRDLNSHAPMVGAYDRMLQVFEPLRGSLRGTGLTSDQLIQILNAQKYRP